jgi:hypothetical protein
VLVGVELNFSFYHVQVQSFECFQSFFRDVVFLAQCINYPLCVSRYASIASVLDDVVVYDFPFVVFAIQLRGIAGEHVQLACHLVLRFAILREVA